jgi:hypothetical protein
VIWNDVVVVGELFVADRAYSGLLPHLAVQQFPHLRGGSQLPISSRVVRIFDALNSKSYEPGAWEGSLGPQQESDLLIGRNSLGWSLIVGLLRLFGGSG